MKGSESEKTSLLKKDPAIKYQTIQSGSLTSAGEFGSQPNIVKASVGSVGSIYDRSEPVTFSWSNINVWVGEESKGSGQLNVKNLAQKCFRRKKPLTKHILNNVNGVVKPGELLAIMGASGAGKTTLINVMTFRNSGKMKVVGQRKINGVIVTPDILTSISAYVQQEDLFLPTLTVREHLVFQALVRMEKGIPYKQRMARVDEVIQDLGLGKCAHTRIGKPGGSKGISGGEMKRLSFASEVLSDCQLVFCDEPTSGLDSYMALNVIAVLKTMAKKGKTIICTIHQPSSEVYALFDRLLLLADGRGAYLGNAKDAVEFFKSKNFICPQNFNPADFYIETLAIKPGNEAECLQNVTMICDAFDTSPEYAAIKAEAAETPVQSSEFLEMQASMHGRSPYKASWTAQCRAVTWRSWISLIREPMVLRVRCIQTLMISLMLGAIYWDQKLDTSGVMNINGAIFLILTNMTFQTIFGVINVFSSELPIFLREHFNGMYKTEVYFLCKIFVEFPLYIIFPTTFIAMCYYMIGLNNMNPPEEIFMACIIAVLVSNVCCSFGYMISCISSSPTMAITIAPPFIVPFMLFGGFFLNVESIPKWLRWIKYLSWFYYGNEAFAINQWKSITTLGNDTFKECTPEILAMAQIARPNSTDKTCGETVLTQFNFEKFNMTQDMLLLVVLIFLYKILAYFALLAKTYRKQ